MSRLLFWLGLAFLVVAAMRSKLRQMSAPPEGRGSRPAVPPAAPVEAMISCAHCHVHFPASEAVRADGRDYCCPAHLRLPPL